MTQFSANPPPLPVPPRRRWTSWLLVLSIFIGGAACGAGLTIVIAIRGLQNAIQHPEEAPARISLRLARRLNLTPSQRIQVEQILARRQRRLQEIRREVQPRVERELADLESQISDVLTPDQKMRWTTMFANLRENWLPPPPPEP